MLNVIFATRLVAHTLREHRRTFCLGRHQKPLSRHSAASALASGARNALPRKRTRLGRAQRPAKYDESAKPASLSTQNDSTSCGAFVFAYVYFLLVHGRLPTPADFTGSNHLALRLVMLHACVSGHLRRGVLPGAPVAGGAAVTA